MHISSVTLHANMTPMCLFPKYLKCCFKYLSTYFLLLLMAVNNENGLFYQCFSLMCYSQLFRYVCRWVNGKAPLKEQMHSIPLSPCKWQAIAAYPKSLGRVCGLRLHRRKVGRRIGRISYYTIIQSSDIKRCFLSALFLKSIQVYCLKVVGFTLLNRGAI